MIECKEHGRLYGRKDAKFCPICGKQVVGIPLFPLAKIYIWKGDLFKSLLLLGLLTMFVVARVSRERRQEQINGPASMSHEERQRLVEQMPAEWQFAYRSLRKMGDHEKRAFLERYTEEDSQ